MKKLFRSMGLAVAAFVAALSFVAAPVAHATSPSGYDLVVTNPNTDVSLRIAFNTGDATIIPPGKSAYIPMVVPTGTTAGTQFWLNAYTTNSGMWSVSLKKTLNSDVPHVYVYEMWDGASTDLTAGTPYTAQVGGIGQGNNINVYSAGQ